MERSFHVQPAQHVFAQQSLGARWEQDRSGCAEIAGLVEVTGKDLTHFHLCYWFGFWQVISWTGGWGLMYHFVSEFSAMVYAECTACVVPDRGRRAWQRVWGLVSLVEFPGKPCCDSLKTSHVLLQNTCLQEMFCSAGFGFFTVYDFVYMKM